MALFLAPFLSKERHRNGREGTLYMVFTLSLLLARVYATDREQGCHVQVLGKQPLSVPLVGENVELLLSPVNTELLLQSILFTATTTSHKWDEECEGKDRCEWWQRIKLTVQGNDLKVEYYECNKTLKNVVQHQEVKIRNCGQTARLVGFYCDTACPIIDSLSMNEIRKTHVQQTFVYGRMMKQNATAVLTKFSNCSTSSNTGNQNCGCGSVDLWEKNNDVGIWEKLTDEENHSKDQEMSTVQITYSTGMEWSLGCRPDADDQRGTTTQDSQMVNTSVNIDHNKVTAHTGQTSEDVTDGEGECAVYMWMTFVAILNTLLLLMLLQHTIYHIYSMNKQKANDKGNRCAEIKINPRKLIDGLLAFLHSTPPPQAIPNKDDPLHSHHNIQVPKKAEDDCQVYTHPFPNEELKTNTEKKQWSPKPTLPSTCPPPCPHPERLSLQDSQPYSNSELKIITERKKGHQLPPLPSTCPPSHPYPERPESQDITDFKKEEEHEYDYICLPIMPTPPQQQHKAEDKQKQTNEKEEVIPNGDDPFHSQHNIQQPKKMEDDSQVHTQPFLVKN